MRLADAETARRYPLTVTDRARWGSGAVSLALPPLPAGTLLRDMGKSITVINDSTKQQSSVYRLVEKEASNPESLGEGAAASTPAQSTSVFYVRVWDSNSEGVRVARTG